MPLTGQERRENSTTKEAVARAPEMSSDAQEPRADWEERSRLL